MNSYHHDFSQQPTKPRAFEGKAFSMWNIRTLYPLYALDGGPTIGAIVEQTKTPTRSAARKA